MQTKYSKHFLKEAKNLRKKYQKLDQDLLNFIDVIETKEPFNANNIKGFGELKIYKARIKNTSSKSGKSGGFRIIYYLNLAQKICYLLTIYSKSEKSDISQHEILKILQEEELT
jgi:mRNA-degrading endonuclease RelE of RelBE toxin-antitoxin system